MMGLITRRRFLQLMLGTASAAVVPGTYVHWIEPRWVEYVPVDMPLRHLPPRLQGLTLVQLSDLHIGNRFDWEYIVRTLEHTRRLQPDFVVYTGDFITYESAEQLDQLATVMQHAPLGRLGTAAILGSHDYGPNWSNPRIAEQVVRCLDGVGITVLRNEVGLFAGLQIAGADDWWGTNFDLEAVTSGLGPGLPTIVLSHNPDTVDLPLWAGYRGWILSGHTHGGQVRLPGQSPLLLPVRNKRYTAGRFDLSDGRHLYINRAVGCLWPVRFNIRPEVTIFSLRAAAG